VDVAHGILKDPGLPDLTGPQPLNAPSAYRHRPELQPLFRSWRAILDSYPAEGFPGPRTAVGEVWYDVPETLAPYLEPGGLPQVFNFQLILAGWRAAEFRTAIDSALAVTGGSRAPWVTGNHDVARPASRYRLDEGFTPQTVCRLIALGDRNVPLPWSAAGTGFGFSRTGQGSSPAEPWLPQPSDWGRYSVESQLADEHSTVNLYRSALRLRREHPALGRGAPGQDALRWLGPDEGGLLCFAREPGFVLAANLGPAPVPLPAYRDVLLASGPVAGGSLPPDTAVWLSG
jgi:alpha-glucosidase